MKAKIWGSKFYFFLMEPLVKILCSLKRGVKISALKKGGQNRGAYQPTSLKGCPPPPPGFYSDQNVNIMMSWHENTFCITGPSWGKSNHWWILLNEGQKCRALVCSLFLVWKFLNIRSCWHWFLMPCYLWDVSVMMYKHVFNSPDPS